MAKISKKKQEELNDSLVEACADGELEQAKELISKGADINGNDGDVIYMASMCGQLDVVKYLVEQGVDINHNDGQAIEWASSEGYIDVVKYLHQNGADLDKAIESAYGETKEELISYKEKILLSSDIKEVKQEQQKPVETKKSTMRI